MMDFNYNFIGNINVNPYINEFKNFNWDEWTYRQDTYDVHSETKSIPLLVDEDYASKGKQTKYYRILEDNLKNAEAKIRKYYGNGQIIRVEIVKLGVKSKVKPHIDSGESLENDKRIHLVLQTNDKCIFKVDGEIKHMKVGEMWEINNIKEHSVTNDGTVDTIHMIIDYKIVKLSIF